MKVILTNDIPGLGDIGQTVNVKRGFARNYLFPKKLAVNEGTGSAKQIEHNMKQLEYKSSKLKIEALGLAKSLESQVINVSLRVGDSGKVFGSVTVKDVVLALEDKGFSIDRKRVVIDEPIKKIGKHSVSVKLHKEVVAKVVVEALKSELTDEEKEIEAGLLFKSSNKTIADQSTAEEEVALEDIEKEE